MERIVLGFSGGVDSAVASVLLRKAGKEVHGVYLDNGDAASREYAADAAARMEVPLEIIDIREELEAKVCSRFLSSYMNGETPNPCIMCNPTVKFKQLLAAADRIGAEFVATGHYAAAENGMLLKGHPSNDQSYLLCRVLREQIKRVIFPLGGMEKKQIRALAEEWQLPAAKKPDSQEICFIPDKDYRRWIRERGYAPVPGDFILHGEKYGTHEGIYSYTVGQRLPGLHEGRKVYISGINAEKNEIQVSYWEELFQTELRARDFNWLIDPPEGKLQASVRVRHTKWEEPPCEAWIEDGLVRIHCLEPVRAPAAGQSAVLYDGNRVLGGGFILPQEN